MSPNCLKCRHYYVTWEAAFPHGCRQFGFKGREMPSQLVKRNSGKECAYFQAKDPTRAIQKSPKSS